MTVIKEEAKEWWQKGKDGVSFEDAWNEHEEKIKAILMGEKVMRAPFLFYLINDLGYTREQCEDAWVKAKNHFPSYNTDHDSDILTLEVATRDILRGDFQPNTAEVPNLCESCGKGITTKEEIEIGWCEECSKNQMERDKDWY